VTGTGERNTFVFVPQKVSCGNLVQQGECVMAVMSQQSISETRPEKTSERSILHVLRRRVASSPDKPWLILPEITLTYREADELSNRFARGMKDAGIEAEETLLVMLPNGLDLILSWLACAKLGVIEVPLNTAYRGDILAHIIQDSRASHMLISSTYLERLSELESLGRLKHCYVRYENGEIPRRPKVEIENISQLLHEDESPLEDALNASPVKAIMYTSGTSGRSKGVIVSHAHAYEYANGCASAIHVTESDRYYTAGLPLFHVAGKWGVLFGAAIKGATAVVARQFSATNFWSEVRMHGVTATYLLGAMANFIQRQPVRADDHDNPLQRVLMCPLLADLDAFINRFKVRVGTAYGSTEANAPILMAAGSHIGHSQVVGRDRSELFEVRIIDEFDEELPRGVVGQIAVRPKVPNITMLGYWHQPEATAEMWRNLWLHTGDAGFQDKEGLFYFTDRLKDTIRRRGENISSMELEGVLNQHPNVQECAVFPVKSVHTEEEVMAAVVLRPGQMVHPKDITRFLEPRMARFMLPRYIRLLTELPKTPTGKVRKHLLREEGITADTWDKEQT
jgi:crotonobetaine/carnitine-CoA ligase